MLGRRLLSATGCRHECRDHQADEHHNTDRNTGDKALVKMVRVATPCGLKTSQHPE